nr:MAG TPA: hypothetical protein [Bacteriophage sp.]
MLFLNVIAAYLLDMSLHLNKLSKNTTCFLSHVLL